MSIEYFFIQKPKKQIRIVLARLAALIGIKLLTEKQHFRVIKALESLFKAQVASQRNNREYESGGTFVVFSKDRPVQLDLLLSSMLKNSLEVSPIIVLYTSSSNEYNEVYDDLRQIYRNASVEFVKEKTDFKVELLSIIESVKTEHLFFLVDDIVFKRPFAISKFCSFPSDKFIPSLRHGLHLKRCYTSSSRQPKPTFEKICIDEENFVIWNWAAGSGDWGYPLSVDGHMFSTREVIVLLNAISFTNPNTLEIAMQSFLPIFYHRHGVCFSESILMNVPINKVQTENFNRSGAISTSSLLEAWKSGKRLCPDAIEGYINISCHEEIPLKWRTGDTVAPPEANSN